MNKISFLDIGEIVISSILSSSRDLIEFSIIDWVMVALFKEIKIIFAPSQLILGPKQALSRVIERKIADRFHLHTKLNI